MVVRSDSSTQFSRRLTTVALAILLGLAVPLAPLAEANHETPPLSCFDQVGVDLALVMDRSGSMDTNNRLAASKSAGTVLLNNLGAVDQSALISFASDVRFDKGLDFNHLGLGSTDDELQGLAASGQTAMWKGIKMAHYELTNHAPTGPGPQQYSGNARLGVAKQAMVLLSDGDYTSSNPRPYADAAKADDIEIFTVALGSGISQFGLDALEDVASSPGHFYHVVDPNDLQSVFFQISYQIRDLSFPSVALVRPDVPNQFYINDAVYAPSPAGLPVVLDTLTPHAVGGDDCLLEEVAFEVQFKNSAGSVMSTVALGTAHAAQTLTQDDGSLLTGFAPPQPLVCPGNLVGPHTIVARAVDWLQKTTIDTRDFLCVDPVVDSSGTSVYTRTTQPEDPKLENVGAHLNFQVPFSQDWDFLRVAGGFPTPYEVRTLHDRVASQITGVATHEADGASTIAELSLPVFGIDLDLLRSTAHTELNLDPQGSNPAPFDPEVKGSHSAVDSSLFNFVAQNPSAFSPTASWLGPGCQTTTQNGATVKRCWDDQVSLPPAVAQALALHVDPHTPVGGVPQPATAGNYATNIQTGPDSWEAYIRLGESIKVTGPGFAELTMNCVHVLLQNGQTRHELIIGQAYAGSSFLGPDLLMGPWRDLDFERDIGRPGDAPDDPATPWMVSSGVYGARLSTPDDVDSYAMQATIGDKVHATLTVSNDVDVTLLPAPTAPAAVAATHTLTLSLLDPGGVVRDQKTVLVSGGSTQVELNTDQTGVWTVVVEGSRFGVATDYTLSFVRTAIAWPARNDAATGYDAGEDCQNGLLVGPGAHVGAIEHPVQDAWDFYRVQLYEGQSFVVTLKPGDTIDSAFMRLHFYDRTCTEMNWVSTVLLPGGFKGRPQTINYPVPVGGDGVYRIGVEYVNGIGAYELAIATSEAGLLFPVP